MKPDYGIDAPGVVRNCLLIGAALLLLAWFLPIAKVGPVVFRLRPMAASIGSVVFLEGLLMIAYSKVGKFHHRDRMLDMVKWRGDEEVLDIGTGRGLLMIGAAKRLTTGRSVGIDIWSSEDLSGNSMAATTCNAELEGVQDKVDVQNADATAMKFPDASFDVVLSNLCLPNIPSKEARDKACREIIRVLKPGGRAIISDFKNTADYQRAFQSCGATAVRSSLRLNVFPPLRIVSVEKPGQR